MENDIDAIIIRKKEILAEINIYQKKLIILETELLHIEKKMSIFSEENIADTLMLSEQQKAIVDSKNKNILVVACPGSGKTHTLISRYINLVTKEKVDPMSIILITFTKKAGMEMSQRISNILPNKPPYYVGSLHGLGFRLLQEYNLTKGSMTVLDENDAHSILRNCADIILDKLTELEGDEISMLRKQIVYIYDKVSTSFPTNLLETIKHLSISSKYKTIITNILKEYKNTKKEQNLVDFNDLMISFCTLLGTKKIEPFLEKIKYIFFDEYQDINPVQNYILQCFKNSNIMVVGDDAQAIYAFRGSSVKYIWDFKNSFTDVNTYYLETNYRSTPSIVSFFQDVISHNTDQFEKNVKSSHTSQGMKPYIMCHPSNIEQYKWVADDIASKYKSGIPLRNMVVLSRKNSSLDMLEHELITHSIPVVKSIGISLLNKQHIKDFIAFLIILTNDKSLIHWKRILSLHRNIGLTRANDIINNTINLNVIESIQKYYSMNQTLKTLDAFVQFMLSLSNKQTKEQINMVQSYLFMLWANNNEKNMESRKDDMISLLMFMNKQSNQSLIEFINNIHLNLEIDSIDDCLFLSTVHGSKGLEWEHVYIIDMDCKNFPNVRQAYYKDEMDNVMEERRLFYVAASRAKKYLSINFTQDIINNLVISPFIRELNEVNYIGSNLSKSLSVEYQLTGNISIDVHNYLRYNGYKKLADIITSIPAKRESFFVKNNKKDTFELPAPTTLKRTGSSNIVGNMMDILVSKMIHNHYHTIIDKFDIVQNNHNKLPEKIYHNIIDKFNDWRNILDEIYYVASHKSDIDIWKPYLLNNESIMNYYNMVEKSIILLIDKMNPKSIKLHMNVSHSPIKGEIDILIDNTLIEMKTTPDDACTFPNLCQSIMYGYLLEKKNIKIDKIIILNLWDGTIDLFNELNVPFYKTFKKILYNVK
jgi:DNA helicase-2/ATP-dependent DNA helicase PcrA